MLGFGYMKMSKICFFTREFTTCLKTLVNKVMTKHNKCYMMVIYQDYESNLKREVRKYLRKSDA